MAKQLAFDLSLNVGDTEKKIKDFMSSTDAAKTKLKELERAAIEASINGNKALSDTFAKAAGDLKDKIGDTREEINNFSSDTRKLDVAIGAVQGIAGAFTATAGAVGLLAGENEDLQKTISVVSSSLAVLNGIQAVANTLNRSSATGAALYAAANKILNFSLKDVTVSLGVLKTALVSTGIGTIVVLLGAATAAMISLTGATDKQKKALDDLNDSIRVNQDYLQSGIAISDHITERELRNAKLRGASEDELNGIKRAGYKRNISDLENALKDQGNLIDKWNVNDYANAEDAQEALKKLGEEYVKIEEQLNKTKNSKELFELDAQIKTKENMEKAAQESKAKREQQNIKNNEAAKARKEANQKEFDDLFAQLEKEMEAEAAADESAKAQQLERDKLYFDAVSSEREKALKAEEDAYNERRKKTAGDQKLETALLEQFNANKLAINTKYDNELLDNKYKQQISDINVARMLQKEKGELTLKQIEEFNNQELSVLQAQLNAKLISEEDYLTRKAQLNAEYDDAKANVDKAALEREKIINDLRLQSISSTFGILSDLNDVFANKSEKNAKKAFENNKKIQIAETLISTDLSAQKAYASQIIPGDPTSPVRAAIAAGISIAAGLARVAKIKSTTFNGGGSDSSGGGGGASAGAVSGGTPASNPFNNVGASSVVRPQGVSGDRQAQRVYVLESDITKTQDRVRVIESNSNAQF